MLCLVTGATGYIGGRLVPELLAAGHEVLVRARHPERRVDRAWVNDDPEVSGDELPLIDGMTSAKHQSVIADHSGGARSDILYRAVQP
jgi:nucleoside-diphosphate-sugar epimerase